MLLGPKAADDVTKQADLLERLLDKAANLLKPGGRLVFAPARSSPRRAIGKPSVSLSATRPSPACRPAG
jgi:tRNA G10  N-methylase Trm11